MANADFSQRKEPAAGGFDAGSYRAAPDGEEQALRLTPLQQKLAAVERRLPRVMQQRAAAVLLCAAVMLGGYLGFGTAKVRAKYNEAKSWYSEGLAADGGYTLEEELIARENYAAGTITSAKHMEGVADSQELEMAQAALDQFAELRAQVKEGQGVQVMYLANETLDREILALYNKMREAAADPMNPGGQYGQFASAQTILKNLSYNEAVSDYEDEMDGASAILKALAGAKKVEYFA